MNTSQLTTALAEITGEHPKGGTTLLTLLERAERKQQLNFFVPWAAPPNGRTTPQDAEYRAIDWIGGESGLLATTAKFVGNVSLLVMPADSYAWRNNFDRGAAETYWQNIAAALQEVTTVTFIPSSTIEAAPRQQQLMAEEAYALERLQDSTREKVLTAAGRYSGAPAVDVYNKAGEYCMARAAEARFVVEELDALWVSLNWPERDAMCGASPRLYGPEYIRTPWLQGDNL